MKWDTIDTAPRDGTRIIVHDGENVFVVAYLNNRVSRRGKKVMEWCIPESWQDEQGGYETVDAKEWMPITSIFKKVVK